MPTTLVYRIETRTTRMGPWKDYHNCSNGPEIVIKNPNLRFGTLSAKGLAEWFDIARDDLNLSRYCVSVYRVRGGVVQSPRVSKDEHRTGCFRDWSRMECVFDPVRAKRIATLPIKDFKTRMGMI